MNKMLALAALAIASSPSMGGAEVVRREPPIEGWLHANGRLRGDRSRRWTITALQRHAFAAPPCDAPKGYLWHRALAGRRGYYLLKSPPGERSAVYDEINDRTIIQSGWGYVKPTYAPGDQR